MQNKLTPQNIKNIVKAGEGYNAEFKVRLPNKLKEITEEICAFANSSGGTLLIGVDDHNVIHGVNIANGKRSAIQNSINEITPHLPTDIYSVDVDGKTVWVITVNSGIRKPYVLSGVIYVRQGPNTQKLTSVEEMRDFFQQSDRIYFDEAPCKNFSVPSDIDEVWFEEFRIKANLSKAITQDQIVQNLKLLSPDGSMKNGGVLFLGKAPEQFFEKAVIRCIAFDGETKTTIIDDKIYGGPLMKQYEQAMQWLKDKLDVRYEISGGGPRIEHWEIPEIAFKETIINALSHRDYYDKGARITIELFKDRVEISNPGGLTSAISPSEFGTKSHSRNPLIFGLFVRINMVEQVGSGIGRVKEAMKVAHLPLPEFKTEGIFTVILQRVKVKSSGKSSGKGSVDDWNEQKSNIIEKSKVRLGKTALKILEMVYNNQNVTMLEMSKNIGITQRGIAKNIKNLRENKILERRDGERSGYWKIII